MSVSVSLSAMLYLLKALTYVESSFLACRYILKIFKSGGMCKLQISIPQINHVINDRAVCVCTVPGLSAFY